MTSTASRSSACATGLGLTAEALRIIERVEREVIQHEMALGRARLLHVIADFDDQIHATHTGYYRRVIRETIWPHGTWVGGAHTDFLRGFECSALGYVWAGFEALRYFADASDWSIDDV